jgi:hypothetical protein
MKLPKLALLGLGLTVCACGVVAGLASPSRGAVNLPTVTITTPVTTVPVAPPALPPVAPPPVTLPPVTVPTVLPPVVTAPVLPPVVVPPVIVPPVTVPAVTVPPLVAPPKAPRSPAPPVVALPPLAPAPASKAATPSATHDAPSSSTGPASGARTDSPGLAPAGTAKPVVRTRTARASSVRIASATRHSARARSVYLMLRVAHRDRLHIALIGPSPSCVTARTLIRRVRQGLNRLQVGPAQVHGLENGRYLVRIPVDGRPELLLTAMTIVSGHRVVRGRRPERLAEACLPAPPAASSSVPAGPGVEPPAATPPATHGQHGFSPSAGPKALGRTAKGAGKAAATAVKTTGQAALRHVLLLALISLVLAGGWAVLFPLARFIHPPRHP